MSKTIVENNHCGKLSAYNVDNGVCFKIELNAEIQKNDL